MRDVKKEAALFFICYYSTSAAGVAAGQNILHVRSQRPRGGIQVHKVHWPTPKETEQAQGRSCKNPLHDTGLTGWKMSPAIWRIKYKRREKTTQTGHTNSTFSNALVQGLRREEGVSAGSMQSSNGKRPTSLVCLCV